MQTTSYIESNNAAAHSIFSFKYLITVVCVYLLICADIAFDLSNVVSYPDARFYIYE